MIPDPLSPPQEKSAAEDSTPVMRATMIAETDDTGQKAGPFVDPKRRRGTVLPRRVHEIPSAVSLAHAEAAQ
jgi:hypothetical protein